DLSPAARPRGRDDSRRRSEGWRFPALGTERGSGVSGQSTDGSEGIPATGGRGTGGNETGPGHVHQRRCARPAAQGGEAEVSRRRVAEDFGYDSAAGTERGGIAAAGEWPGERRYRA